MGDTIACLPTLLFQFPTNSGLVCYWDTQFRVLVISFRFIDGQIEYHTFYGSGIFTHFSSQKVPSRRIWETLPTHRITPHGTLFVHWTFACALCTRIDGNRCWCLYFAQWRYTYLCKLIPVVRKSCTWVSQEIPSLFRSRRLFTG
jgi:hypothetical protein